MGGFGMSCLLVARPLLRRKPAYATSVRSCAQERGARKRAGYSATMTSMDVMLWIKVLILGVVEGITEFLPVSSTGHLIIVGQLLDFNDEKGKIFEIVIQTGAMLAIVWEYRAKFAGVIAGLARDRKAQQFVLNLAIAFMPAAILGLAFGKYIKAALFKPVPVALAFIVGGVIILWAERRKHVVRHVVERCAESRVRAGIRADSRHVAFGRDHHRRIAVRTVAARRH
jgi:Bacitracin resistance protein BacA